MRADGRRPDELRPVEIIRGFTRSAPGSVLIRTGRTHVFCTASLEAAVPPWREKSGAGWVTAEYEMLPASTAQRRPRSRLRVDGRTREIERVIGRALRMAVDMQKMGSRMVLLDCDVLQADGGTRTAAITGVYVALCDALDEGRRRGWWGDDVLRAAVAAVSVGIVDGQPVLDLDYVEDVNATVDCNLVMTDRGEWVEVQATGESAAYTDEQLAAMLKLGRGGIEQLFQAQRAALRGEANGGR